MIIVEGPDNSGKSTLIKNLAKDFKLRTLKCSRHGPPIDGNDNYQRTQEIIERALKFPDNNIIVDRISLIGEEIYGPILRGKNLWVEYPEKKRNLWNSLRCLNTFFIYCRPPNNKVLDLSTHELKKYDTKEHVLSVSINKDLIVNTYDNYFAFWEGNYNFFKYDYTNPVDYQQLKYRLKEYLDGKHFRY